MEHTLIRQIWHIISHSKSQFLREANNADLVEQLLTNLQETRPLSLEENNLVRIYLQSKAPLIRDLAHTGL